MIINVVLIKGKLVANRLYLCKVTYQWHSPQKRKLETPPGHLHRQSL